MKNVCFSLCALFLFAACTKESVKSHEITEAASAVSGGRPFSTVMTGAAEVPGPGDPDGYGIAEIALDQGNGTITYRLTAENIAPATAAHIHIGTVTERGPVVVGLTAPTTGESSGVATNVNPELIKAIRKNPENYYVNVHNVDYPGGAIRGQLSK